MRNDTLNALITHHGNALLREAGWPATVHVHARATTLKPDALALRGRLSAGQVLALVSRLCRGRNDADSGQLTAVAKSLSGTPAELYMTPKFDRPEPRTGAALLYGRLLMSKKDCNALLAFLNAAIHAVTQTIRDDARRIGAALKPSGTPRLLEKQYTHWRLTADEYDHENWLDSGTPDELARVLDAILHRQARYCPVMLTVVNRHNDDIESCGVITDTLRVPGDKSRRWLDLRVLADVTREARAQYRTQA